MKKQHTPIRVLLALLAAFTLLATACGSDDTTDAADSDETSAVEPADNEAPTEAEAEEPEVDLFSGDLVGLFAVDSGSCADGTTPVGSYFRMVQPGGDAAEGPFIENFDSGCSDTTYSVLNAGSDGGLMIGADQWAPDPAFDAEGNGLATSIIEPVTFFGVDFAAAAIDDLPGVTVSATDGVLSGQTTGFTAYYGGEPFNQGAPKPEGETVGLTTDPTGTIDAETGAYILEWQSQISGGAFNEFTGIWHLEGTFTPTDS